jgi:hypothetical protein
VRWHLLPLRSQPEKNGEKQETLAMKILKTTILALTAAASLGAVALSSATPASAHYRHHGWAPKYWNYGYSYRVYRPYCVIKFDYYGNPYKACF